MLATKAYLVSVRWSRLFVLPLYLAQTGGFEVITAARPELANWSLPAAGPPDPPAAGLPNVINGGYRE